MNMYDTSVKVPFIVSGPTVPCGRIDNKLHSHYDVFPTLIDYTGINCMIPANLPGKSFASLLRNETNYSSNLNHIVVFDEYGPVRMIRGQRWKYIHRYPYGPHEFYDLVNDPDECFNLIDDKSCSELIDEHRKHLTEWFNKYVDPNFDGAKLPVTGLGQVGIADSINADKSAFIQN
jgi:arylsulfatase A-like enzyme